MLDEALLSQHAKNVRMLILRTINRVGTGHAGSSLSMIELLVYLYFVRLRIDPKNPRSPERDYFILSKGHGAPGLYAVMAERGYFDPEEMFSLRQLGSRLQGHPNAEALPGIDASTGSLGQGISIATGIALGLKMRGLSNKVYCVLGDGELQEGQNWEAFMFAASQKLSNLTVIVDRNQLQNDGATESIVLLEGLAEKFRAFGFDTHEIDGHNWSQLDSTVGAECAHDRPRAVIALTTKGKGVSYMEGVVKWHHHPITDEELTQALDEVQSGF